MDIDFQNSYFKNSITEIGKSITACKKTGHIAFTWSKFKMAERFMRLFATGNVLGVDML